MSFADYFMKGVELIKLNSQTAADVSKDEQAFGMAILFIILGGVASAIGSFNPLGIVIFPIGSLIGYFVWVGILHILAKIFGGAGSYMELFRPLGIASIISWITVIPLLGPMIATLAGLWMIVVEVVVIRTVHQLSTGKAVAVVLIPVVIMIIIGVVIAALIVAMFASMGLGGLSALANQ